MTSPLFVPSVDLKRSTDAFKELITLGKHQTYYIKPNQNGIVELRVEKRGGDEGLPKIRTFSLTTPFANFRLREIKISNQTDDEETTGDEDDGDSDDSTHNHMTETRQLLNEDTAIVSERANNKFTRRIKTLGINVHSTPLKKGEKGYGIPPGKKVDLISGNHSKEGVHLHGKVSYMSEKGMIETKGVITENAVLAVDDNRNPVDLDANRNPVRKDASRSIVSKSVREIQGARKGIRRKTPVWALEKVKEDFVEPTHRFTSVNYRRGNHARTSASTSAYNYSQTQNLDSDEESDEQDILSPRVNTIRQVRVGRNNDTNDDDENPSFNVSKPRADETMELFIIRQSMDFNDWKSFHQLSPEESGPGLVIRQVMRLLLDHNLLKPKSGLREIASTSLTFDDFYLRICKLYNSIGDLMEELHTMKFDETEDIQVFLLRLCSRIKLVFLFQDTDEIPLDILLHYISKSFSGNIQLQTFFNQSIKYEQVPDERLNQEKLHQIGEKLDMFLKDQSANVSKSRSHRINNLRFDNDEMDKQYMVQDKLERLTAKINQLETIGSRSDAVEEHNNRYRNFGNQQNSKYEPLYWL